MKKITDVEIAKFRPSLWTKITSFLDTMSGFLFAYSFISGQWALMAVSIFAGAVMYWWTLKGLALDFEKYAKGLEFHEFKAKEGDG